MKAQKVDTPYRNSYADLMARKALPVGKRPVHPTHKEQQKLMILQGWNSNAPTT